MNEVKNVMRTHHIRMMETDPIYREGHAAETRAECPYAQPEALQHELMELSCKPVLTTKDCLRMADLHKLIDATEGQRWVRGFYSRERKTALDF